MKAHRAYIGAGSNVGERVDNLNHAISKLAALGGIERQSSFYVTEPWGKRDQPPFVNAVVAIRTTLSPNALLAGLQEIETLLGRRRSERWAPRVIDLDLLLYDDLQIATPQLRVPHRYLRERAFVLVPLSEIDDRFVPLRDALPTSELAGVVRIEREGGALMSEKVALSTSERVRALARFLATSDAIRVRIRRDDDEIEVAIADVRAASRLDERAPVAAQVQRFDTIKADLVGVFHLSRPTPFEGEVFDGDRELGYIEALGIRTPVHSMGGGQLVSIAANDGTPVEYGQALFVVARGK